MKALTIGVRASEAAPHDPEVRAMMEAMRAMTVRGPWDWIVSVDATFEDDSVTFLAILDVPDRDHPYETKRIHTQSYFQLFYEPIEKVALDFLLKVLEHELKESVYSGAVRVFDPHEHELPRLQPQ